MTSTVTPADTAPAPQNPLWRPLAGGFWEGLWRDGARHLHVYDPEDRTLVGTVMNATDHEVDKAIAFVARGHRQRAWPLWQRREAIEKAAARVAHDRERFARLITAESSKTLREADREVTRAMETLRLSAQASSALTGRSIAFDDTPRGEGWTGWYTREPVGVVAAITPFNDPLNLVAHKLGPALIAGNAVVLKPSGATPVTALALVDVLLASGVPPEYLAVVTGDTAGQALVANPAIDVVSFTGGPATADLIAHAGPARKLLMELGGNNARIACADADPEEVAASIVDGAFGVAGQNCLSVQRVFVHNRLYRTVVDRVVEGASALVVGSKRDPATDIGPLIDEDQARRITGWIDEAVDGGAVLRTGGVRTGTFVTPAVLTDVPRDAQIRTNEVFGPVVMIDPFTDLDSVIDSANAVDTGLQAGVFTQDIDVALDLAAKLRVGAVLINSSPDFRIDAMPFGGVKRSGIGREGVWSAVEALTEPKIVAARTQRP
ncbi:MULTISPECIES: aldehyde dehydrogenase family protein [Rhodococcus]|uniref:Putative aldehyde dehydrogenase n=2 Tax=Rhodococcus opacus TaxID=37919 RepID=C1BD60_RHOOB|nr:MULTISPECIES: aldehyde dehydrogenase family protein [Rhodococcus]EID81279.1 putative aldehyde dehydrogenase [Rhodococcus opacus RKJ300 = JCM 13270]KAF0957080.1 Sulfoacetaldehyde dehydrogenase [Rhodococcus sp. T7]KAF0959826.1 Sulfoacetaldehyde dehydrogenase [Rhodococcus sp. T7]QQZ19280.1 aldehyde dehydrogenase family protein [Rhodococcus sp. 21391]UOT08055.1 aldehyde dehydrogenase family protein [Rhodococcus opacus]